MKNYYLGGDASKGYTDFVIIDDKKKTIEPDFQMDDTYSGHQNMEQVLNTFFKKYPDATLHAAIESTGGYENNWIKFLKDLRKTYPINVARVNPKGVNHDSKAALQKSTNDKISARNIAEYQINHPEKIVYNQDDSSQSIKRTLTVLLGKIKFKAALVNQLETLLYSANPEIMQYRKHETPQWLLRLLKLYPTAASLAKATVEDLAKIPYISRTKAQEIITQASRSVASASDDFTTNSILCLVTDILYLEKQIKQEIKFMQSKFSIPQIDLLKTFKGIGTYSAMILFVEIGNIELFPTAKHLASFFGLHPIYKESGDGKWGWHMSKQGRKKPRHILYMVALSAIITNDLIRDLYHYHRNKGKGHKETMGICMHKICRIIYGMLKHNKSFDENIDRKNQKRNVSQKKTSQPDVKRRYHKEDSRAPISQRQTKKRKERELSQSDDVTVYEINAPAPSPCV